jgi:hypothetical protein
VQWRQELQWHKSLAIGRDAVEKGILNVLRPQWQLALTKVVIVVNKREYEEELAFERNRIGSIDHLILFNSFTSTK